MKPHADIRRDAAAIMANWRQTQGHRAAAGSVEVLRALEAIAGPLAWIQAFAEEIPDPRRFFLTKDQLTIGRQRAVSQERTKRHGPLPRDPETWWAQISEIQAAWSIDLPRAAWTKDTPKREAA